MGSEERKCGARAHTNVVFYECQLPRGHQGPHKLHFVSDAVGDDYKPITLTLSVMWQPREKVR